MRATRSRRRLDVTLWYAFPAMATHWFVANQANGGPTTRNDLRAPQRFRTLDRLVVLLYRPIHLSRKFSGCFSRKPLSMAGTFIGS